MRELKNDLSLIPQFIEEVAGSHFCPGAGLARMQTRVALETLLKKMPDLRPAQDLNAVSYSPGMGARIFDKLIVAAN